MLEDCGSEVVCQWECRWVQGVVPWHSLDELVAVGPVEEVAHREQGLHCQVDDLLLVQDP